MNFGSFVMMAKLLRAAAEATAIVTILGVFPLNSASYGAMIENSLVVTLQ